MVLLDILPPHRIHLSRQIPPSKALSLLSKYLVAAIDQPYLQPNALLTAGGPVFATSSPHAGLTLHNLHRVAAGLRGEHLSAELLVDEHDYGGLPDNQIEGDDLARNRLTALHSREVVRSSDVFMGMEDWQDKTEFEREQDITQGEVGDRLQGVTDLLGEDVEVPRVHGTRTDNGKEDRKRRKRERRRAERAESEARKKGTGFNRK
ncbi:hypothetical protein MMC26_007484 [Xylographa opegraphella]|nr:hypothetical protein [Xylographa opegraphella]